MTFGAGGADAFKEIIPITFGGFLLEALAKGCVYKAAPPPEVVPAKGFSRVFKDAFWISSKRTFRRGNRSLWPMRVFFGFFE